MSDESIITKVELDAYFQESSYTEKFLMMKSSKSIFLGFNLFAAVIGASWFMYRKMFKLACLFFLFGTCILAIVQFYPNDLVRSVFVYVYFFYKLLLGVSANSIYIRQAEKTIKKLDNLNVSNERYLQLLKQKGGTNFKLYILSLGGFLFFSRFAYLFIQSKM